MKLLTNLDLGQNELRNALMHPLSSAPAEGQKGQLYYNNVEDRLYQHNGTAWVGIATLTDLEDYVPSTRTINGKPLTENVTLTTNDIDGVTSVSKGGTGYTDIADTTYTTARYRASALYAEDSIVDPTTNGVINWAYA